MANQKTKRTAPTTEEAPQEQTANFTHIEERPLEESSENGEDSTQHDEQPPISGFPVIIPYLPGTPLEALQMAVLAWRKFFLEPHDIIVIGDIPEGAELEARVIPFSDYAESSRLSTLKMILTFVSEFPELSHFILSPATTFCLHPSGIEDIQLPKCALQDKKNIVFETGLPIYFRTEALLSLFHDLSQSEDPDFIGAYYMQFYAGRKLYLLNIYGDDFRVPIGRPNPNIERLRELAERKLWATVAPGVWSVTIQQELKSLIEK